MSWIASEGPEEATDDVHVIPKDDLMCHLAGDCPCGPSTEPVPRDDGSMGWLIIHHSLDGRERFE